MKLDRLVDQQTISKLQQLQKQLKSLPGLVIAFSGGVDSTLLLKVASDILGEKVIAVTAKSLTFPAKELSETIHFAQREGLRQIIIDRSELAIEGFAANPRNRCYLCKRALFTQILALAHRYHITSVAEGSNLDDLEDYRPGRQALAELGVLSPLVEVGLNKGEIRALAKTMNLSVWDKPSLACLASRIPYGQEITKENLQMVDQGEQFLIGLGFSQVRVRHHGDMARIEVAPEERFKFMDKLTIDLVDNYFNELGFKYVALDLKGYRRGSMN